MCGIERAEKALSDAGFTLQIRCLQGGSWWTRKDAPPHDVCYLQADGRFRLTGNANDLPHYLGREE